MQNSIPGVEATRLMIEVVDTKDGYFTQQSSCQVDDITIQLENEPAGIFVWVGSGKTAFERAGDVAKWSGLADALNEAARDQSPLEVLLSSPSPLAATVTLTWELARAQRAFQGNERERQVTLPPDTLSVVRAEVNAGVAVFGVELGVNASRPSDRRVHPASTSPTARSQLCTPDHSAAQCFAPFDPQDLAITAIEVLLLPQTTLAAGTLALHPDDNGHPAAFPFHSTTIDWTTTTGHSQWATARFETPLTLGKDTWWLVFTTTEGEVLWPVHHAPLDSPMGAAPLQMQHRRHQDPWCSWPVTEDGDHQWAATRIYVSGDPRPLLLAVRRGEFSVDIPIHEAQAQVELTQDQLDTLNEDRPELIAFAFLSEIPAELELSDLLILTDPDPEA